MFCMFACVPPCLEPAEAKGVNQTPSKLELKRLMSFHVSPGN